MAEILIQGILCKYRDLREGEEILYSDLPKEEQYFRKIDHPFSDDDLVAIANKEHNYTDRQSKWIDEEKMNMDYPNGKYAMINGNLTYIPASYWCYINHWTLENGKNPDYREADRLFFLFKEFLYYETQVLGVTRGKGRRQGATSIGAFWEWWICGRKKNSNGGIISYGDTAGGDVFNKMFLRGFKALLPCFQEETDSDSNNFIRFLKNVEKKKKGVNIKRDGLNSYIDYRPTTINSYDSGRLTYGLFDESGKYEKMDINTYWSKVSPTLKEGRYKVGFAYLPTTVNPKKKGGENYKKFWEQADQNAINPQTGEPYGLNTRHKVVRYFVPATEGYAGCIDKFGNSIVEDPVIPVMGNDGIMITEGSRSVILKERALKEGEQLMEHRRDFPLDLFDMFSFETGFCEFNEPNILKQLEWLNEEENKKKYFLRQVRLIRSTEKKKDTFDKEISKDVIGFMDDPQGTWLLYEPPEKPNNYKNFADTYEGLNTLFYSIGVDTFKGGFAAEGSKGTICVFKKSHIVDGKETGLYPVAFYVGRPRLVQHFYDEVFKACMWYGSKVNFEIDAGDQYYGYFLEKGGERFLEWTPAVDLSKRHPLIKPGTESASPFQLAAQLEAAKSYIDGTQPDGYNGNVHRVYFPHLLQQLLEYNHAERTPYDSVIALMMALLPALKQTRKPSDVKIKNLLPTYKIEKYA
jgi:hypothetical protein